MSATPTNDKNITKIKRPDGTMRLSSSCKNAEGEPRTEQSHAKECDIRNIVRKYAQQGIDMTMPDPNTYSGEDAEPLPDYTYAMQVVANGQSRFASLPARIRDRFKNDPSQYLAFLQDPRNASEAVSLGLAVAKPTPIEVPPPEEAPTPVKGSKKSHSGKPDGSQPKGDSDQ